MKERFFVFVVLAAFLCGQALTTAQQTNRTPPAQTTARTPGSDLTEYGVSFEPEPRLIVMMAALEAAGIELTPQGGRVSPFRQMVRRDLAGLDAELRARLQTFYKRHKLPEPATPAAQAARYVSLAYALGPPPMFESPARSDDLPAGVLEVLDFAPLLREFYRRSGIDERLPEYLRDAREAGNRLRPATAEMVRAVLSYLHTRPQTSIIEQVIAGGDAAGKQKDSAKRVRLTRERERRFRVVPDPLAAPGAINFRVIGDDYYAIVPLETDPASSELRRAYLQYVIDPLVLRFNRDIAARRAEIRSLLEEYRTKSGQDISIDVFLSVARALVAAADARMTEAARLDALTARTRARLAAAKTDAERAAIVKESQAERVSIEDATVAQLADAYERGALLSFYFAEQLRGLESSGFDIAAFLPDMLASFQLERERRRAGEYAEARARHAEARRKAQAEREAAAQTAEASTPEDARRASLIKSLEEIDELLRAKSHAEAQKRLNPLMLEFQGEPRIFFALGQAASLSAEDAFDAALQAERLERALGFYRQAVERASLDTDRALICRSRAAMGRILAFLERQPEALKEFDAALQLCEADSPAYKDALAGKKQLQQQN